MWRLLEPIHALTYFDPAATEALTATGLRGYWMTYFAARSAPMGAATAPVVEATFYNFAPWLVRRAIPDAWSFATSDVVLEARWTGIAAALAPHAPALGSDARGRALLLLGRAVDALRCEGRPLAAANAALVTPDDELAAVWQQLTTIREHRGDGHVAALVCASLSGLEAHVTLVGAGATSREVLQAARGFTDEEWAAAEGALADRGLLLADGALSDHGWALRREVEATTDRAASAPWARLGDEGCDELVALLSPLAASIASAGIIPATNPIGVPRA